MTREEKIEIATAIRTQISMMTYMACGAREFVALNGGLQFKVGGRMRYVKVELTPADTYNVKLVRVTRNHDIKTVKEINDIYCDQLSEAVYDVCNKK